MAHESHSVCLIYLKNILSISNILLYNANTDISNDKS